MAFAAAFIVLAGLSAAAYVWGLRLPRERPPVRKAALAAALRLLGVPATEADLSVALRPTPYTGTNEHLLALELDRRLAAAGVGRRARLTLLPGDLQRLDSFPVVATRGLSALVNHWIVLGAPEPDGIRVYDPISGVTTVPYDRLARLLNPVAIRFVSE